MTTDLIEKQILLLAPQNRVWRAISDSTEFGAWFGVKFDGPFTPGAFLRGVTVSTIPDPEIAEARQKYDGMPVEITIDQIEPERLFSFRWHPYAIEPGADYSSEPTTLVVFTLEKAENGVVLTITESGFDRIPLERRAKAFAANDGGWNEMVNVFAHYIAHAW